MRRLPPLSAVRAFEAAARLGGFGRAAQELGVTQGAISHQIRRLESHLGAPLFHREPQGVALTALGARALPEATAALDQLTAAFRPPTDAELVFRAPPTLALRWLLAALRRWQRDRPDPPVSLIAADRPYDPRLHDAAAGVVYCRPGEPPPEPGTILAVDLSLPVAPPALRLTDRADLATAPLLKNTADPWDWRVWADTVPGAHLPNRWPAGFETDDNAIQAALDGAGIVLANVFFVAEDLASGRLVPAVPDTGVVALGTYWLTWPADGPPGRSPRPPLDRLLPWLVTEAEARWTQVTDLLDGLEPPIRPVLSKWRKHGC